MQRLERQLWRNDDAALALRQTGAAGSEKGSFTPLNAANFSSQVAQLAASLPAAPYVINLVQNRYFFSLSFCAVIGRGACNLLPQNAAIETQKGLLARYPEAFILHDGQAPIAADIPAYNCHELCSNQASGSVPKFEPQAIDPAQPCAIAFTSGSTGQPKANIKTWATLLRSSQGNYRHMGIEAGSSVLATVPAQHMWGLETSVLLPLFFPIAACDIKPFFPADIAAQLRHMPQPRVLVSTPVHLRALMRAQLDLPKVERILCATAPLEKGLAEQLEQAMQAPLTEIYGCSEIGSMACREPVRQSAWRLFDHLQRVEDGQTYRIKADHLPETIALQDDIAWLDQHRFELRGRNEDMLEVAGKRGSLKELNRVLLSLDEVEDGVVFIPPAQNARVQRPAAFVVSRQGLCNEGLKERLQKHFLNHVDPVFVPRPFVFVEQIPRGETGKIGRTSLLKLWTEQRS